MNCQHYRCRRVATVIRDGLALCPHCWALTEYEAQQAIAHDKHTAYTERNAARLKAAALRVLLRELHQPRKRSA